MKKILMTAMVTAMALSVQALGQNLIVNGDFESPLTFVKTGTGTGTPAGSEIGYFEEITSEYTALNPMDTGSWTLGPEYYYTVSTDPHLYHSAWSIFGDHTTGLGKMMIVNGTWSGYSLPDRVVWAQTVLLCDPVTTYALWADNGAWEAGEVQVKAEAGKICVRIVLTDQRGDADEGWLISKMHVAVAATCEGIPQKNGNPLPGKFPINLTFTPGVLDTGWQCLPYAWTAETSVCIAAGAMLTHAEVLDPYQPYDSETGWGEGTPFPGKNWATCMSYTPKVCPTSYLLEFWAGNSYLGSSQNPAEPAILAVQINGVDVGTPLALDYPYPTAPTPGWMKFSTIWDAGSATSATIEIRDKRYIMYGDDFVIDDISLEKQ